MRSKPSPFVARVRCPHCYSRQTRVYKSARQEDGSTIQYRRCLRCDSTFKTIREAAEDASPPASAPKPRSSRP